MKKSVLIVDDELDMQFILEEAFKNNGYEVYTARDGNEGLEKFRMNSPSIVISDIMMSGMDGLEMVRSIRSVNRTVPILLLTSKVSVSNAVEGLATGANDYIRKPFSVTEVIARANSFLNFLDNGQTTFLEFGKFTYEPTSRTLRCDDKTFTLTGREGSLLELLAKNLNKTVKIEDILATIWKNVDYFTSRSMHVQFVKLRKYLSEDPNIKIINEKRVGYKLVDMTRL